MSDDAKQTDEIRDLPTAGSVTHLFALARDGDVHAFEPLWERFFPRLTGLARKRLSSRPAKDQDAEDAAQAALISFWKQIQSGQYVQDLCRGSLWNLLATITARKVSRQLRKESAQRHGGGRIVNSADLAGDLPMEQLLEVLPTQELDAQVSELLNGLPDDLQEITVLRLLGHSTEEIALRLECTQRKIQRKLELVRLHWSPILEQEAT
jgi:RNA polymerase sigma factor (sigma-70 family)